MTEDMVDDKPEPAITLTFPELRADILEIMQTMFQSQTENYVTKSELAALRQHRDTQTVESNLRLDKMDIRLEGLEKKVESLFGTLDDIKKSLTNITEKDRQYRQHSMAAIKRMDDNHQEYQRRIDGQLAEVRDMATATDTRTTQSLEVANSAVERANQSMGSVAELRIMVETKIDPISAIILGDDSHPSLLEHWKLQQTATKLEMSSSHNQLQMLIAENQNKVEALHQTVQVTLDTVSRFNKWADRVIGFAKSKAGIALITGMVTLYLGGSPLGDAITTFIKYLTTTAH